MLKGSIKIVDPLEEISWIKPFIVPLYSCFIGITNLLFLIVIIGSWTYFLFKKEDKDSLIVFSMFLCLFRIEYSLLEALSSILFSSIIAEKILSSIFLLEYRLLKYSLRTINWEISISSLLKYCFNSLEIFNLWASSNKYFVFSVP